MRYIPVILLLLFSQARADVVCLGGEVELGLPIGWSLYGDTSSYPFLLMPESEQAEVLLFRSTIEASGTIDDQQALKLSVDRVVDSVVMSLPGAQLLTTTGFHEGSRSRFVIEFLADGESEGELSYHNLAGIMYRTESGDQILFTLWGRSDSRHYTNYRDVFETLQRDFRYIGGQADDVFLLRRRQAVSIILPVALALVGIVLVQIRKGQLRKEPVKAPVPVDTTPWQCGCGHPNDYRNPACARCGYRRVTDKITS